MDLITISTDFEIGLIESVKDIFSNVRHVGCLFHYAKQNRLNILKIGLYGHGYNNNADLILKEITKIPFYYNYNNNIINDYFNEFKIKFNKDNFYLNLINKYEEYFKKQWLVFLKQEV